MNQSHGNLAAPSPFVQVCDRCRWKKIKCDGARPCSNCRNANFPCETRARLSKQATPRTYVQYLEARVRQLEGQRESEWSPQASSSRHSPYGESHLRSAGSVSFHEHPKKQSLPDWSVLRELGTHVVDEDGFSRYMGPSSGVGFSAKVLQEILDDDQPPDPEFYSLFSLDDFSRSRALEAADAFLWEIVPTNLPSRPMVDKVLNNFFTFTERVFPVLHRPTFTNIVNDLYNQDTIGPDRFEHLAQFYFTLSIGYWVDTTLSFEERTGHQIRALQTACRCYFTTLHTRRDGLTRLQTLTLHSYALVLLRQRSEALRMSAMANTKALEVGLHHDGRQYTGNPLETEMRRRVFWCVFMLHLFTSAIEGLPRALHEADITITEPSDIDDDQLTTTGVLNSVPGRTKIHRFVSVCRLVRILSRTLDVLYTHNKRKQASTRIEQMNRLCCEHLLDQLDFSFEETPDDIPDPTSNDPTDLAILASYVNEQILFHYIRWLIHRPGLALSQQDPQFAQCLQISTEAASELNAGVPVACQVQVLAAVYKLEITPLGLGKMLTVRDSIKEMARIANVYFREMPFAKANPACHPCTIFIAGLTPLYRTALLKSMPTTIPMLGYSAEADLQACKNTLNALALASHDHSDVVQRRILQSLMTKVFGDEHQELQRLESIRSHEEGRGFGSGPSSAGQRSAGETYQPLHPFEYDEQQIEHFTAHEDLRSFVHEAFSPQADPWGLGSEYNQPSGF